MNRVYSSLMTILAWLPVFLYGQEASILPTDTRRDSMLTAARQIINNSTYCALITLDETGQPSVRTMNPYPLEDNSMEIWFATSRNSRKVIHIRNDQRVNVYYADHTHATGYVSITGNAVVIDDAELLVKKKRAYWEDYNMPWKEKFVLIKVTPVKLDVINYEMGINGDPDTFRSPSIIL